MNKTEFIDYISTQHDCTKAEANKMLTTVVDSISSALASGKDILLVGFGKFYTRKIEAREGRNPKNGAILHIPSSVQAKFSAGQTLKDACNLSTNKKENKEK